MNTAFLLAFAILFATLSFAADKNFACNNDEIDAMSSNFNTLYAHLNMLNADFTIQERRLAKPTSGTYILNGRKE